MEVTTALQFRARVEDFRRRHRTGLVTLLFSDIVGSMLLKEQLGDERGVAVLQSHHALVRNVLGQFKEAEEISTWGDSFFIVFVKPSDALRFALLLQNQLRRLAAEEKSEAVHDRIGIHVGEVVIEEQPDGARPRDLYGLQVDVCARLMEMALPDQVLLSRVAFDSARPVLKGRDLPGLAALSWLSHGRYQFTGLEEPVEVCEVGEAAGAPLKTPLDTAKAKRVSVEDGQEVLGWRPALGQVVPNTRWELESKLGEGGFGEVWLASHQTLKQHRVFKFCFRADRVRWLRREASLFRILQERVGEHRNIMRLLNVNLDDAPFYIEMEHCDGGDLKSWCRTQGGPGRVPLAVKLEIAAQVADALQAAHSCGIIHRDIKPGNILIQPPREKSLEPKPAAGSAPLSKLTDFGVGHVVSNETLAGLAATGLTQTVSSSSSVATGTVMYMAPELLSRKAASPQSDIYSLGVVLYQFLVGDFSRALTMDWAKALEGQPRIRAVLEKCFAGEPSERFGSAGEMAAALRESGEGEAAREEKERRIILEHSKVRRSWRRRLLAGLGALGVVLGLCAVLWMTTNKLRLQRWVQLCRSAEQAETAGRWRDAATLWERGRSERIVPVRDTPFVEGMLVALALLERAEDTNTPPAIATNLCAQALETLAGLEPWRPQPYLSGSFKALDSRLFQVNRNAQVQIVMRRDEGCRVAQLKARRAEEAKRWTEALAQWQIAAGLCPTDPTNSKALGFISGITNAEWLLIMVSQRTNMYGRDSLEQYHSLRKSVADLFALADSPDRKNALGVLTLRVEQMLHNALQSRFMLTPAAVKLEVDVGKSVLIPLSKLFTAPTNFDGRTLDATSRDLDILMARIEQIDKEYALRLLGNRIGQTGVQFRLSDPSTSSSESTELKVSVVPKDPGPMLTNLGPSQLELEAGQLSPEIPLVVVVPEVEDPASLRLSAQSGNQSAVPVKDIHFFDRKTNWTVQFWPAQTAPDPVLVVLWASSGRASNSIRLQVKVGLNNALSPIAELDARLNALRVQLGLSRPSPEVIDPWTGRVATKAVHPGTDLTSYRVRIDELRKALKTINALDKEREAALVRMQIMVDRFENSGF